MIEIEDITENYEQVAKNSKFFSAYYNNNFYRVEVEGIGTSEQPAVISVTDQEDNDITDDDLYDTIGDEVLETLKGVK